MWCLLEGGAHLKVREMSNIKCQNLVIFLSKYEWNINFTIIKPVLLFT